MRIAFGNCREIRHSGWHRCTIAAIASMPALLLCVVQPIAAAPGNVMRFKGICNASAGVALNDDLFVVADDEDRVVSKQLALKPLPFRVYSLSRPGEPISL